MVCGDVCYIQLPPSSLKMIYEITSTRLVILISIIVILDFMACVMSSDLQNSLCAKHLQ